jgi:IS4 transposase
VFVIPAGNNSGGAEVVRMTTQKENAKKAVGVLGEVFAPFVEHRPLAVMARGLLERLFRGRWIDELFEDLAESQYTRQILFSSLVGLMLRVVLRTSTSVRAAYGMAQIGASLSAVYEKLQGVEPDVLAALVHSCAIQVEQIHDVLGSRRAPLVEGRRVRILDGNAIKRSQHRIKELRDQAAGPLPGKSLVVYDPAIDVMLHVIPCEDGHAQERSLLDFVLARVDGGELWIADRNFCVFSFLEGIVEKNAEFLIRHHKQLTLRPLDKERAAGKVEGGRVTEQAVAVYNDEGRELRLRCVRVYLRNPTRDGDRILVLLTNLPCQEVPATRVANLYRKRWTIESAFHKLQRDLKSEIDTLGYPRAALFGFAVAVIAYNAMSAVQGALRAAHGDRFVDEELSHYELAHAIEGPYEGMVVAIPDRCWRVFRDLDGEAVATLLINLARCADIQRLRKAKYARRTKVPTKRHYDPAHPHVSTARILAARKKVRKGGN